MIVLILIAISGLFKGLMDKSSENRFKKDWYNKSKSWGNKWKTIYPTKERFWGSSRWFVFLTDGWHLFQFLMYRFNDAAIMVLTGLPWYYFVLGMIIIPTVRGLFFNITHKKINK